MAGFGGSVPESEAWSVGACGHYELLKTVSVAAVNVEGVILGMSSAKA